MLLIAFDSTQQALRMEMLLDALDIESDTQPTPKAITAGCALAIGFAEQDLPAVRQLISGEKVVVRGIYRRTAEGYESVNS